MVCYHFAVGVEMMSKDPKLRPSCAALCGKSVFEKPADPDQAQQEEIQAMKKFMERPGIF